MKKKIGAIAFLIIAILVVGYFIYGNPLVLYNNYRLERSVREISETEVTLNEIVPFEWDTVYTFSPYTSSSEIEKIIGFKSNAIKETVNEGMVQLLFVKDHSVVCSVCGYAGSLGYRIDFYDKVEFEDHAIFEVRMQEGIACLEEMN